MGLTHCYKTTVFLHLYLVIGQSLYWPREFEVINISHWNFEHIDRKQHDAEIVTRKLAVRGTASIAAPELEYCDQFLKQIRLFAVKLQRKKRFQHFCVLDLYLWPRPKCRGRQRNWRGTFWSLFEVNWTILCDARWSNLLQMKTKMFLVGPSLHFGQGQRTEPWTQPQTHKDPHVWCGAQKHHPRSASRL